MPWVQTEQHIRFPDKTGKRVMHFPGDILFWPNKAEVAKHVKEGRLSYLDIGDGAPEGVGILWRGKKNYPDWFEALGFEIQYGDFSCPFPITVVMGPRAKPKVALLLIALNEFAKHAWDMAVPLLDYRRLAEDIGTAGEREKTQKVIRDLRVPVYTTDLVLLKSCPVVLDFLGTFDAERANGQNERLAFLRALYTSDITFWPLQKSLYDGK